MVEQEDGTHVGIESGVNAEGAPFCIVSIDHEPAGQLDPDEVRVMALDWLGAAEAAEHDAAVFRQMRDSLGLELPVIGAFIHSLRKQREESS